MSERPELTITVRFDPDAPPSSAYYAGLDDDYEPGMPVGRGRTRWEAVYDLNAALAARDFDDEQRQEIMAQNQGLSHE